MVQCDDYFEDDVQRFLLEYQKLCLRHGFYFVLENKNYACLYSSAYPSEIHRFTNDFKYEIKANISYHNFMKRNKPLMDAMVTMPIEQIQKFER